MLVFNKPTFPDLLALVVYL